VAIPPEGLVGWRRDRYRHDVLVFG